MATLPSDQRPSAVGLSVKIIIAGALAACAAVLIAMFPKPGLVAVAAVPAILMLLRGGISAALFVFVIIVNVPAVLANFHGVPKVIAAGVIGLLAIPVFRNVVLEKQSIRFPRIMVAASSFQLIQFLGVLVAVRPEAAILEAATAFLEGLLLFVLFVNAVRTESELRLCLIAALFAGAFMSLPTIHQARTGSYFRNYGGLARMGDEEHLDEQVTLGKSVRHAGPIGEKNRFALVLLLAAPFVLVFFGPGYRKWLPFAVGSLLLILAAFVLTRSRGGIIALGAMVVTLIIVRRIPLRYLIGIGILASPGVALLGADYVERASSIVDVVVNASSGSVRNSDSAVRGRLNEMGAAVLVFLDHPVTGVGPGMFHYHYRDYAGLIGLHVHNEDRNAHCTYLQVAAEHGAFGIILFMLICWRTLASLHRAVQVTESPGLKWMLTAILVAYVGYMTGSVLLSFTFIRYFWLILAISWVGIDLAERQQCEPSSRAAIA